MTLVTDIGVFYVGDIPTQIISAETSSIQIRLAVTCERVVQDIIIFRMFLLFKTKPNFELPNSRDFKPADFHPSTIPTYDFK